LDLPVIPIHDRLYLDMGVAEAVSVRVVVPETVVDPPVAEAAVLLAKALYPERWLGTAIHIEQVAPFEYDVAVMVVP
jgi:hypothetical protein